MEKVKKLIKRYEMAKGNLNSYYSVLKDAYTYALPDRGYFNTLSGNGKRTLRLFDSTAILGVGTYADKVQQNIVPSWRNWFILVPGSEIPDEVHEQIQPQLDAITDTIYDHINHSNFATKMNEALQDAAISTGIITCEEGDGKESSLIFDSKSVETTYFEESSTGIIENTFTKFKIKIADIEQVIQGAKLTPKLAEKLSKDPNAKVELIEAIVKNRDLKYEHTIFSKDEEEIIFESVDDTNPYIIFRERVTTNSVYGMGRVIQLLNDIKVLNKISELDLKNAGLAVSGVYTATDDGVINPYNVRLEPGTIIPVGSNNNQNPSLRPLEPAGNFNLAQIKIEQKQELINKVLFGMPLGSVTRSPVRTATEVDVRQGEQIDMTNAAFSRFQTELLERLIKRIVDVLQKAGKIAPIVVDGKEITIKFTSPLARQKDMDDISVIVNYAQTMAATGIPMETLGNSIKFENIPKYIAEKMGIESELVRTEMEKQQYAMQKQQAAMAQQQAAMQGEPSGTMG